MINAKTLKRRVENALKELIAPQDKVPFHSFYVLRHTQRRQEHLATLGLPIAGASVLEVGAGIGDHTSFFLDRNCDVVITEPREINLSVIRSRFPDNTVVRLNLDKPDSECLSKQKFDIVYCYGVLYHLSNPEGALEFMAKCCRKMLLVDTCVSHTYKATTSLKCRARERLGNVP